MKLLFDENLSPKLVSGLAPEYPGSAHVRGVALRGAEDHQIWSYARAEGFTIAHGLEARFSNRIPRQVAIDSFAPFRSLISNVRRHVPQPIVACGGGPVV